MHPCAPAAPDVSPLCLVSVNVSTGSQAWSCDRSADEPLLPHPLPPPVTPPPPSLHHPAFSAGIKYPLLSRHHLWHMDFLFNFRSEAVRHRCWGYDVSQCRGMPSGQCRSGSVVIAVHTRRRTGVTLMAESCAVTSALCSCNLWHILLQWHVCGGHEVMYG